MNKLAVIILAIIFGWGRNGFGGNNGGGMSDMGALPYVMAAGTQGGLTRADLQSEFGFNGLENSVRGVQSGLCDGFYALNTSILDGFHGVSNAVCDLGYQTQQGFNNTNVALKMKNSDGSTGPHWDMAQTEDVRKQHGYTCDPAEFYAAINMCYSDYYKLAKDFNLNNTDFYARMAHAFLDDEDAGENKIAKYYDCVVK